MPELNDLPGYREAEAEYAASVAVATQSNDELGKLKAENDWLRKQSDFKQSLATQIAVQEKLAQVKVQVEKDYPMVPAAIFKHLNDPEAILEVARDFQKNIDKQQASWGTPGGAPVDGDSSGQMDSKARAELVRRVNTGDRQAITEYKHSVWANRIRPFGEATGTVTPLRKGSR